MKENVILKIHPAIVPTHLGKILMLILFIFFALSIDFTHNLESSITWIIGIIPLLLISSICVDKFFTTYTITDKHIILNRYGFSTFESKIKIEDIKYMSIKCSFMQQLFATGDIHIATSATSGIEITMKNISNPRKIISMFE